MANYAVTDTVTVANSAEAAAAAMETLLEAVDSTKTIRLCTIIPVEPGKFAAIVVADA